MNQLTRATLLGTIAQIAIVVAGHFVPAVANLFAIGGMGMRCHRWARPLGDSAGVGHRVADQDRARRERRHAPRLHRHAPRLHRHAPRRKSSGGNRARHDGARRERCHRRRHDGRGGRGLDRRRGIAGRLGVDRRRGWIGVGVLVVGGGAARRDQGGGKKEQGEQERRGERRSAHRAGSGGWQPRDGRNWGRRRSRPFPPLRERERAAGRKIQATVRPPRSGRCSR